MDDCRLLPLPSARIPIISAGQSEGGTRFAAQYADYNFRASIGINQPEAVAESVALLVQATAETGRACGALILTMIIADETDAAALAKWEHYKSGTDLVALGARREQAELDTTADRFSGASRHKALVEPLPTNQGVLVGSYASIAAMLDRLAAVPGVLGVMMTFDDYLVGMEQFGTRIIPLMRSRAAA
jgi:pyrimidine oxygenase